MLTQIVNGQTVEMTADEETAIRAFWAANDALAAAIVTATPTITDQIAQLEQQLDSLKAAVAAMPSNS
jgi:phage shock protein A